MAPVNPQILARNATLRNATPRSSRPASARPTRRAPDRDEVALVVPAGAAPGQPLFFRDGGVKCRTTVPAGARPGHRFTVRRSACAIQKKPGLPAPRLPPRPRSAPARRKKADEVEMARPRPKDPYAHIDEKDPFRDPFVRDLPAVTDDDRALIKTYQARQKAGLCTDESFWKEQGFKAAGDPSKISEKKKKDYGFGAPKWSPYYRHKMKADAEAAKKLARQKSENVLGDQAWWEQYGFKGAVSEEKKRDYGNGVPNWSPYHHGPPGGDKIDRTGLPADAYWFSQFGFKMGGVSKEKMRDYGYGVPMWSPYYRSKAVPPGSRPQSAKL